MHDRHSPLWFHLANQTTTTECGQQNAETLYLYLISSIASSSVTRRVCDCAGFLECHSRNAFATDPAAGLFSFLSAGRRAGMAGGPNFFFICRTCVN